MAAPPPPPVDETGPIRPYIVGGNDATENYGFVASLQLPQPNGTLAPFCTGSLITDQVVMTAAHCAQNGRITPGVTKVHVGSNDNTIGGEHLLGISRVEVHERFDMTKAGYDLALVKLDRPVPYESVMLAASSGRVGSPNRIMGFGAICDRDLVSDPECRAAKPKTLQELDTKRIADSFCKLYIDPKLELCIGSRDGKNKQACFGDSGGPLVKAVGKRYVGGGKWKTRWALIGATTGDGDDTVMRPHVCTTRPDGGQGAGIWQDLTQYRPWIFKTVWKMDRVQGEKLKAQIDEVDALMAAA